MTIKEMASQLHQMSSGSINGEHFYKKELEEVFHIWLKGHDAYIGTIVLPDGEWFFEISRFGSKADQYDYYIPITRKAEESLKNKLFR